MDFVFIRLSQADDQQSMVIFVPVLGKPFVGADQQPLFRLRQSPYPGIRNSLQRCAADIDRFVSQPSQFRNCDTRDIFIDENLY